MTRIFLPMILIYYIYIKSRSCWDQVGDFHVFHQVRACAFDQLTSATSYSYPQHKEGVESTTLSSKPMRAPSNFANAWALLASLTVGMGKKKLER